ncbi:DUF2637 domain-containing protein [Streptomyces sp. NBC_01373]|uniref:DUF2637 domain-containing protein n=1 Tax=Streptomyces sp. NBC_01373 TaxID=2903843 RepID=UPI002255DD8C|nr:DUF2637 domain-containing protein [Streptomyces sp. NBC_01373]MCX4699544.1 DUF2637 domain-containing protein [Streptomyces sp. NBC_01373]
MKRNPSRALAVAAGLVIVALTAAAFWLSYAHLAEVALAHGMRDKEVRAWAWPATLDLFIVAGELLMLRAALASRVDWWAIGLTVVGSGGSIVLNVAGVGSHAELLDYVVAAVPPTAALLAFGALMRQIHQALAEHAEKGVELLPTPGGDQPAEVTVERVEADRPHALPEAPKVVPAGVRMLPLVARPEPKPTFVFDHSRQQYMPSGSTNGYIDWPASEEPDVVTDPYEDWSPDPDGEGYPLTGTPSDEAPDLVTTSVPAEAHRQVVTEVVTLTPSELRRRASKLNREVVTSTNRPVTIERLREEFGLSRRDAAELRREVVGSVALVPGEARS